MKSLSSESSEMDGSEPSDAPSNNTSVRSSDVTELKDYTGGCHCRKFLFNFSHPVFENGETKVMSCNCSICNQHGLLHMYALSTPYAPGAIRTYQHPLFR